MQQRGGPVGGCATSRCAMATATAAPTGTAPPWRPSPALGAAWGISGATPRTPQPGAASHCPRGQGEPCEVCPTISEGMLGATGLPGKPGPRGAPGAPGKDGVSVSPDTGACGQARGLEGRAGSSLSTHNALSLFTPSQDRPGPMGPKGDRVGDGGGRGAGWLVPSRSGGDTEHHPAHAGGTRSSPSVSSPGRPRHPRDKRGEGECPSLRPPHLLGGQPPAPPLSRALSLPSQGDSCLSCDARVLAALLRGPAEGLEGEPAPASLQPGLPVSTGGLSPPLPCRRGAPLCGCWLCDGVGCSAGRSGAPQAGWHQGREGE